MEHQKKISQSTIHLGTHGENYGTWMSHPVFYMMGGFALAALILAVLSFAVFHIAALGVIYIVVLIALIAFIGWMEWIRSPSCSGNQKGAEAIEWSAAEAEQAMMLQTLITIFRSHKRIKPCQTASSPGRWCSTGW